MPEPRGGHVRQLPEVIWQATVASEDRTFWENNGVDFQGIVRAALANLEAGEIVQGASTITQQVIDYARVLQEEGESTQVDAGTLARGERGRRRPRRAGDRGGADAEAETDVCQPPEPNNSTDIQDKIRENILAMQVTAAYPGREGKERILETYLNLIYYGNGSYGIKAAAANYFGLTNLADMTDLAGRLPGRPARRLRRSSTRTRTRTATPRTPRTARADALRERNLVLGAMLRGGVHHRPPRSHEARATTWLADEPEPADEHPAGAALQLPRPLGGGAHPRDAAWGHRPARRAVRTGGYRITTTLDYAAPAGGEAARHEVGGDAARRSTSTTRPSWRSTRRPGRSSPTSAASTTTTARTPASRASSTWPGSAGASPDRPSSRSRTRPPSSRATRPCRRCSSTP